MANRNLIGPNRAAAGFKIGAVGAQRRQSSRTGQGHVFIHHPQREIDPSGHAQLAIETFAVGMNRIWGDLEIVGDGGFGMVIKHAPHDLKMPPGEFQAAGDFLPRLLGEYVRAQRMRQSLIDLAANRPRFCQSWDRDFLFGKSR